MNLINALRATNDIVESISVWTLESRDMSRDQAGPPTAAPKRKRLPPESSPFIHRRAGGDAMRDGVAGSYGNRLNSQ